MSLIMHLDKLVVSILMFQLGCKFHNPVLCISIAPRQWYKVVWLIYTGFSHYQRFLVQIFTERRMWYELCCLSTCQLHASFALLSSICFCVLRLQLDILQVTHM